jgi:hypothetical protein
MGGALPLKMGACSYAAVRLAALACSVHTQIGKRRCRAMKENGSGSEGLLLVRAEPLGLAEEVSRRMVDVERTVDGALLLDVDPAWAGAINTVLVSKGVWVDELRKQSKAAIRLVV